MRTVVEQDIALAAARAAARPELLKSFQRVLDAAGIERAWPV